MLGEKFEIYEGVNLNCANFTQFLINYFCLLLALKMSEFVPKACNVANLKLKPKVLAKKGALSVINGDINTRKRSNNSWKLNCKSQKQETENNPHVLNLQKLPAFASKDVDVIKLKRNGQYKKHDDLEIKSDVQTTSVSKRDIKVVDLTCEENSIPSSSNDIPSDNEIASVDTPSTKSSALATNYDKIAPVKKEFLLLSKNNNKSIETSFIDSVWCTPYRHDIYAYFKSVERKFYPNPNYMEKQSDITMSMRSVLIDWFIEVGEEYKLHAETLYLAVLYVDRFLSHMAVLRGKLQLVGTASMFLASKYEEIYPPELSDFVYITDDTYSKKQILRMEHLILKVLNFDVSVPTALTFLLLYCSTYDASESVIHLAQYICELSLLDGDPFLKFYPSIIAAGSLALANYTLGIDMWDADLVALSGYQLKDLTHVILCLHKKYSSISSCAQQSICDKYKSAKYSGVATIQHPDNLIFPENSSKRFCYV